jgi:hypothetical protein
MIDLTALFRPTLQKQPYEWAATGPLFSTNDAEALASSFPCDHFKTVRYYGERDYEYEARSLINMGATEVSYPEELSDAWLALAHDLLSPAYRAAISLLSERDLSAAGMEVNVFHYGPGANLGPHPDLEDKIVTHIIYFNRGWNPGDGGCLEILRSSDPGDVAARVEPLVGNSAVVVRSESSWHAVSRVVDGSPQSRRSLTATFYREGSISTMWPPGEDAPLHSYAAATGLSQKTNQLKKPWANVSRVFLARLPGSARNRRDK